MPELNHSHFYVAVHLRHRYSGHLMNFLCKNIQQQLAKVDIKQCQKLYLRANLQIFPNVENCEKSFE
jgi:hypothetical protein